MGDVGVVVPVPFSPKDTDSVRRVIAGSDIVINLIGKVILQYIYDALSQWSLQHVASIICAIAFAGL